MSLRTEAAALLRRERLETNAEKKARIMLLAQKAGWTGTSYASAKKFARKLGHVAQGR